MANLKGSKTEANLQTAFAGESMARNKYTYFASKARKDGYVQIAKIFEETANNEKEHAKIWFKLLNGGIDDTAANLKAAAAGENVLADESAASEKADISPEVLEAAKAKTRKLRSPKEWWEAKPKSEQAKFISFLLILGSIFMWFMGYNAVSSNLSVYTTKALNLDAGVASIISGVTVTVNSSVRPGVISASV